MIYSVRDFHSIRWMASITFAQTVWSFRSFIMETNMSRIYKVKYLKVLYCTSQHTITRVPGGAIKYLLKTCGEKGSHMLRELGSPWNFEGGSRWSRIYKLAGPIWWLENMDLSLRTHIWSGFCKFWLLVLMHFVCACVVEPVGSLSHNFSYLLLSY